MPMIVRPQDESVWLDLSESDLAKLSTLLAPLAAHRLEAYPVAPLVNSFQNEGPALITPAKPERAAAVQAQLPI